MSSQTRRLHPGFFVVVAALCLVTSACGVRLDSGPEPSPTPDTAEKLRRQQVQATQTVIVNTTAVATGAEAASSPAITSLLDAVLADSTVHDEVLNTDAQLTPSRSPAPAEATPVATASSVNDLATLLRESSDQALAASVDASAADAAVYSAIGANRYARAYRLAYLIGEPLSMPTASLDGVTLGEQWQAAVTAEDKAGYALEVAAARTSGSTRDGLAAKAREHRERGAQLADELSLTGKSSDPRKPAYDISDSLEQPADALTFAANTQTALGNFYLELVGKTTGSERELANALLTRALLQSMHSGAQVPPLPGFDVTS